MQEDLVKARLTPETWRLEIVSDGTTKIEKPRTLDDDTAIDLPTLEKLGARKGIKFLKAMQCLNIPQPLGQGLWEGVPLRDVLKLVGKVPEVAVTCQMSGPAGGAGVSSKTAGMPW